MTMAHTLNSSMESAAHAFATARVSIDVLACINVLFSREIVFIMQIVCH